jgi:hypothetical protein
MYIRFYRTIDRDNREDDDSDSTGWRGGAEAAIYLFIPSSTSSILINSLLFLFTTASPLHVIAPAHARDV